jgi:photosystem II stability/assembly factor-like uncharacterized protein
MAGTVTAIQFVTSNFGLATASGACSQTAMAARCPSQLLVSRNGGRTWQRVLASRSLVFGTARPGGRLWAAQVEPKPVQVNRRPVSAIRFLASGNGGRTWRPIGQVRAVGELTGQAQIALAAGPGGLSWASIADPAGCAMHGCFALQLLGSADGGRSWGAVTLPASPTVGCGPASQPYSVGTDGSVWVTSEYNAGACDPPLTRLYRHDAAGWQQLSPWRLPWLISLAAVTDRVAYALAEPDNEGPPVVVRTTDGGRSWKQLLAVAPTALLAVVSPSLALGARAGSGPGVILRSTDGGGSWHQVADLPGHVTQLAAPSASLAYAVVDPSSQGGGWQLWRSTDSGLTWHLADAALPGTGPRGRGVLGPWMTADGRGVLLTVGAALDWAPLWNNFTGPGRLWLTQNAGRTWRPLPGALRSGANLTGASFAPGTAERWIGWITHPGGDLAISSGTGLRSRPWPGAPRAAGAQLIGPQAGFTWITTGDNGATIVLSRTTDDGKLWRRVLLRAPTAEPGGPVFGFASARIGWLVIGATTWRTTDGGLTWRLG